MDFLLLSFLPLCSGTPEVDFLFPLADAGVAAGPSVAVGSACVVSPSGAVTSVVACSPAVAGSVSASVISVSLDSAAAVAVVAEAVVTILALAVRGVCLESQLTVSNLSHGVVDLSRGVGTSLKRGGLCVIQLDYARKYALSAPVQVVPLLEVR